METLTYTKLELLNLIPKLDFRDLRAGSVDVLFLKRILFINTCKKTHTKIEAN